MITTQKQHILDVYLHSQLVGQLHSDKGTLKFAYNPDYLTNSTAIKLSISLPLQKESFDHATTYAFFSGLLPEENVRQKLAKYLGLSEKNIFALLKAIGGECAGAVSVYSQDMHPTLQESRYHVLTEIETQMASLLVYTKKIFARPYISLLK